MDNLINNLVSDQTARRIELVGKFFVAIAAAAYLSGIIIVNLYLGQFGYYSLSLFRLNYVLAGFWAIATLGLAYILVELVFIAFATAIFKGEPFKNRILPFLTYVGGTFLFGYAAFAIAGILGVIMDWSWLGISFVGLLGVWGLTKELPTIVKRFTDIQTKPSTAADTIVAVLFIGFFVMGFAGVLYPEIPANFGGGQPKSVQIVPAPTFRSDFHQLGLFHSNSASDSTGNLSPKEDLVLSDTLSLLLSTEDDLVFLLPRKNNQSVILRKETVSAIVFHKHPKRRL